MTRKGLILTGTRGAGKSTVAYALAEDGARFAVVPAITTRAPRKDDRAGAYRYICRDDFAQHKARGELLLQSQYLSAQYGILNCDVADIVASARSPILTITPEAALRVTGEDVSSIWVAVFVDAPDSVLNDRLVRDGRPPTPGDIAQRLEDRANAKLPLKALQNVGEISSTVRILVDLLS